MIPATLPIALPPTTPLQAGSPPADGVPIIFSVPAFPAFAVPLPMAPVPCSLSEADEKYEDVEPQDMAYDAPQLAPEFLTLFLNDQDLLRIQSAPEIEAECLVSVRSNGGPGTASKSIPLFKVDGDTSAIHYLAGPEGPLPTYTLTPGPLTDVSAKPSLPTSPSSLTPKTVATEMQELDGYAQDIAAISAPSRYIAFRMEGAQLGQLDVQMLSSEAGVSIHFRSESDPSRLALTQAQPRLVDDFRGTGIRISETSVSADADQSQRERAAAPPPTIETACVDTSDPTPPPTTIATGRFA